MLDDEIVTNCQECIRAQRRGHKVCKRHLDAAAIRQARVRSRRKDQGICPRCGENQLPEFLQTIRGEQFAKECLSCAQERERERTYSVELFSVLNPRTGQYEMRVRRGRLLSEQQTSEIKDEVARIKQEGLKVQGPRLEDLNEVSGDSLVK